MSRLLKFFLLLIFATVIVTATACTAEEIGDFGPQNATRTPVGTLDPNPLPVTFTILNADPFTFRDKLVRVQGQLALPASPSCYPLKGPLADWSIVAENFSMDAIGFNQLPQLAPIETDIVVDGIWRAYQGPAGCGKEPATTTVWYLEVLQIVSPNPLNFDDNGALIIPIPGTPALPTTGTGGEQPAANQTETPVDGGAEQSTGTETGSETGGGVETGGGTAELTATPIIINGETATPNPNAAGANTPQPETTPVETNPVNTPSVPPTVTTVPTGTLTPTPTSTSTPTSTPTATSTPPPGASLTPVPTTTLGSESGTVVPATPLPTSTPSGGGYSAPTYP